VLAAQHITYKHGKSNTRLYKIWHDAQNRCFRPDHNYYQYYGGRGISICQEWLDDFMVFYNWAVTHGYADDLFLDRRDNDRGYSPENCRWVDKYVSAQNIGMKIINTSGYKGVYKHGNKWHAEIANRGVRYYIGSFNSVEDGAVAYNNFIIKNDWAHTLNVIKD
jgi:hypothetical protein